MYSIINIILTYIYHLKRKKLQRSGIPFAYTTGINPLFFHPSPLHHTIPGQALAKETLHAPGSKTRVLYLSLPALM